MGATAPQQSAVFTWQSRRPVQSEPTQRLTAADIYQPAKSDPKLRALFDRLRAAAHDARELESWRSREREQAEQEEDSCLRQLTNMMLKKTGLPPLEERARGPVLQARNAFLRDLESVVEKEYRDNDRRASAAERAVVSAREERHECLTSLLRWSCDGEVKAVDKAVTHAERLRDQARGSFDLDLYLRRLLNLPTGPLLWPKSR